MITQTVNLLVGYQVGNSQENSTRSLCLIRALYVLNTSGLCYNLMSASFPTQGYHVVYMCPDIIFQIFPLCSRLMTSHHVTCHVTAMSCASSLSLKGKIKRNSKKRNIKSRKIDKRERKMLVSKRSITSRINDIIQYGNSMLVLQRVYGLQGRIVIVCIQTTVCSIYCCARNQNESSCTQNSCDLVFVAHNNYILYISRTVVVQRNIQSNLM